MIEDTEMVLPDIRHVEGQEMRIEMRGPETMTPEPVGGMTGDPDTQDPEQETGEDKKITTVG